MTEKTTEKLKNPSLGVAADSYLQTLGARDRHLSGQEIRKFVTWFGTNHALGGLTGTEIAHYADRIAIAHSNHAEKLEPIRTFLAYAKKQGWTKNNLATNLKARKISASRIMPVRINRETSDAVQITQEGLDGLAAELEELKSKRPALIEEIQKAAADKDFRENVPLHAAREARGHLEGRIIELEVMLKNAVVIDEHSKSLSVNIGDTVVLCNVESSEERRFTIVSPREVDAARGKISCVSPFGQALINRRQGETIEVVAPAGRTRFKIKLVAR